MDICLNDDSRVSDINERGKMTATIVHKKLLVPENNTCIVAGNLLVPTAIAPAASTKDLLPIHAFHKEHMTNFFAVSTRESTLGNPQGRSEILEIPKEKYERMLKSLKKLHHLRNNGIVQFNFDGHLCVFGFCS